MRSRTIAILVVGSATLVAAFVFATRSVRPIGRRATIVMPSAEGLREGATITYLGFPVGRIDRLRIDGARVIAELQLTTRDVELHRGQQFAMKTLGLLGDKVLDIVPGNPTAPPLGVNETLYFEKPPAPRFDEALAAALGTVVTSGDSLPTADSTTGAKPDNPRIGARIVDRVGPVEIEAALGSVGPHARGVVFPGARDGNAQYVFNRRTTPSDVEQHDEWDDLIIVHSGHGLVRHGGQWSRSKAIYVGEKRGGSLVNPLEIEVGPGDVVRVPAGEPHRVVPKNGETLSYLVVKVRIDRRP
jgi:hypothetical protein